MNGQDIDIELKKCNSVKEMFDVLTKYYDLENCKPASITKSMLISGLKKGISMTGAKLK